MVGCSPLPPPPLREAAERLQLHLQQQPASPPPGAPLDLGREQPRQQLETKINSPHPELSAQRAEAQPEPRLARAARLQPTREVSEGPLRPERSDVCVRVYSSVCCRHPAPAPAAYGRVRSAQRLARASQAEVGTATGARLARRQSAPTALPPPAGRAVPWGLRLSAAGTRPRTTAKKKSSVSRAPPVLTLSGWLPAAK